MQTRKEFVYENIFNQGYTPIEFSEKSGVSLNTLKKLDDKKPREMTYIKIAKGLGDIRIANMIRQLPGKEIDD